VRLSQTITTLLYSRLYIKFYAAFAKNENYIIVYQKISDNKKRLNLG